MLVNEAGFADADLQLCVEGHGENLIADLHSLYCSGIQVDSLDGLEQLTALQDITFNAVTLPGFDPLEPLPISKLELIDSGAAVLEGSDLPQLQVLQVDGSQITRLNTDAMSNLRLLHLANSPIPMLDLSNNAALTELKVMNLALDTLVLGANENLMYVELLNTQLDCADLTAMAQSHAHLTVVHNVPNCPDVFPQTRANHYNAPRAAVAPVLDGVIEPTWDAAPWQAIDVRWLGAQDEYPTPEDYTGRYKAMWDEGRLYLLVEVNDDNFWDDHPDPYDSYWVDDTVEIFLDENKSGGNHQYSNFANAWAYHVSQYLDVADQGSSSVRLYNDHVSAQYQTEGTRRVWELSVLVYGEDYGDYRENNVPLELYAGKQMGFSLAYIDNDGSLPESSYERESMMGSVDTQGHKDNQGYINADVLGSMDLVNVVPAMMGLAP